MRVEIEGDGTDPGHVGRSLCMSLAPVAGYPGGMKLDDYGQRPFQGVFRLGYVASDRDCVQGADFNVEALYSIATDCDWL